MPLSTDFLNQLTALLSSMTKAEIIQSYSKDAESSSSFLNTPNLDAAVNQFRTELTSQNNQLRIKKCQKL